MESKAQIEFTKADRSIIQGIKKVHETSPGGVVVANFKIEKIGSTGLKIIHGGDWQDERGYFRVRFTSDLLSVICPSLFYQENISRSRKGVIRGMHWQIYPHPQGKLVSCINGKVLDVVVDIRRNSPTYRQTFSVNLNATTNRSLWIPHGFAHGFQALEDDTIVAYLTDGKYAPEMARSFSPLDRLVGKFWTTSQMLLSKQDRDAPNFSESMDIL
jgi:dTDP-4-dehydrorhamnose 3,5-epimerase